jgi:glycyl-tRNA synthetase beta chain
MAKDLLLEIGTEEIPARFMPAALMQLENAAKEKFAQLRIEYGGVRAVGTPRRIALVASQVAEMQADVKKESKGPSAKIAFDEQGNPTKAALGFARGQGIDAAQLVQKDGYVYAMVEEKGRPVFELLPQFLLELIAGMNFPKTMRWGNLDLRFVRPIKWLAALFGSEVIPFSLAGVTSGNSTRGHRFLSSGDLKLSSVDDYYSILAENHVIVDQDVRRKVIREQVEKIALGQGGAADIDEDLLEEVVYLVEYPTALCGRFEEKFLSLPAQAIITPMREHQRYFPVLSTEGTLLPVFITVRNGGADYLDVVRQGNERVLRARLSDARFFFEEDKKVKLVDRLDKLKSIVFQEGLGSLYDKTLRIERLAGDLAKRIGLGEDLYPVIERGAKLSKADLVTGMVCEFTELQGVMGREYALLNGEDANVAEAIFEHYLPRFAGDRLPQSHAGRVIGMADKIDNIVATFSRGLIPTGSQDPYALRRQALGVVNMLIDAQYHVSLSQMLLAAMDLLGITANEQREKLLGDVQEFFRMRLKNVLTDENIRYDMVDAVLSVGSDDIYDTWLRAKAMAFDGGTPAMQKVVQAFTRAGNLAKNAVIDRIDEGLFETAAEKKLYDEYLQAKAQIEQLTVQKNYSEVLAVMAHMAEPIDGFFGAVMVMVENQPVRYNRLALLKSISGLAENMADLSKITVL